MENNLDKYFRDNLHDRQFEMKEAFWLGAEKMLEQQEARRKRRGLFWWLGGGSALLAVAVAGWIVFAKSAHTGLGSDRTSVQKTRGRTGEVTPVAGQPNDSPSDENSGAVPSGSSETDNGTTTREQKNDLENIGSAGSPQAAVSQHGLKNQSQSIDNQLIFSKPGKRGEAERQSKGTAPADTSAQKLPLAHTTQSTTLPDPPVSVKDPGATDQDQSAKKTPTDQAQADEDFERLAAPGRLAQTSISLTIHPEAQATPTTSTSKTEVSKQRAFHFGWLAAQHLQPSPDSGEMTRIGFRTGLVARLDLSGNWYLASGLQYQRRSGTFEASKTAINRNYRFGVELDTVVLRPDGLHYLSVPILLGWERNRHQLEAGLLVDFLTGVHGASGKYVKTGQPATRQFQKSESGWIAQTGYRNWVPTAQANYWYRLNQQFSVGMAANFTINSLLEAGSEPSAGGFPLKETNRFFLSGQVVYLIR